MENLPLRCTHLTPGRIRSARTAAILEAAFSVLPQPGEYAHSMCGSRFTTPLKGEIKELMRPKKTILCVDDNEQALSVRKFMLETRGYRVLTANGSEKALELFREGGIDLVLSDLIMPYMDGNELVRRMKEWAPEVPAILISGSVKAFDRANRADAFLPKGACSPVELLERIRVMVARKRGPKKGHPLRPLVEERHVEVGDTVVVGA
jgi:two-component system, OmpR family, response regulator CpxR